MAAALPVASNPPDFASATPPDVETVHTPDFAAAVAVAAANCPPQPEFPVEFADLLCLTAK